LLERDGYGDDGILHAGNLAWRALANLQLTLEKLHREGHDVWTPSPLPYPSRIEGGRIGPVGAAHDPQATQRQNLAGNGSRPEEGV
jgi:hypothetical protein